MAKKAAKKKEVAETVHERAERLTLMSKERIRLKDGYRYVDLPECAKLLGLHLNTAYALLRAGRIDGAIKIGRSWRIPVYDNAKSKEAKTVALIEKI